jgi:hypothetical protein
LDQLNAIRKYFEYWKRFTGPTHCSVRSSSILIPARGHAGLDWAGRPDQLPLRACLGVVPTARRSRPPALRPDRASYRSDTRHLPPSLHMQHMQPPPMCTTLRLTRYPNLLDAEAKPHLPSPLPRNAEPLPSPVRTPPLCTDDVHHDQITAQEHHLPVVEP